jgi:aminopeptidase
MFSENQLEKYADVLLWGLTTARKGKYRKNDVILIQYDLPALRLAEILFDRIIELGMHPIQRALPSFRMERSFYGKSGDRQLVFTPPGDKELTGRLNGRIFLRAPESLTHLQDVDPKSIGKVLVARKPLREIMDRREDRGLYSWTLCLYPTRALAEAAHTSLRVYTAQIERACYLDRAEPSAAWDEIYREATAIKKWLTSLPMKHLSIESENTDLRIVPGEKRRWEGISGHNIPSFEIFTSPDWRGTEGIYYANLPSFRSGNIIEGVRLTFRKGRVVRVEASTGEAFATKQTEMDQGAGRVGEFSLTDRRFSRIDRFMADTLFDENFGGSFGNCHVALGSSYTGTYRGNPAVLTKAMKRQLGFNESALHWDLVNTEDKTVTAELRSGKRMTIYEKGRFAL